MSWKSSNLALSALILSVLALTACVAETTPIPQVEVPYGEEITRSSTAIVTSTPTQSEVSEPSQISFGTILLWLIILIGIVLIIRAVWQSTRKSNYKQPFQSTGKSKDSEQSSAARKTVSASSAASKRIVQSDQIFISYRRADSIDVTGRIYDRLTKQFGSWAVFKDVDSIPLGVNFKNHLEEKVGQCRIFIVVIGDNWITIQNAEGRRRLDDPADFIRIELNAAFDRNIPIIPVLVQNARMPVEDELPDDLKPLAFYNGISVRPDPDFHRDMDRLITGLKVHLEQEE